MSAIPIVFVARNNVHLTKLAVKSALAQDVETSILLVDNASCDGTPRWAESRGLTTILARRQWSLAKCWNVALAALWSVGHERAVVCNNDIEMRSDAVRLLDAHGGQFVTCVGVGEREQMEAGGDHTERPHPDFSCFLIRKPVTDSVGWFDESYYPAYCEDSDYHVRMQRAGIRAVSISVPFLHHAAATLKHAKPADASLIRRGADLNRAKFKTKYGCLPGSPEYSALFA